MTETIKEATAAQHFDLPKGEPARFVRNGVLETCQCTDCAALAANNQEAWVAALLNAPSPAALAGEAVAWGRVIDGKAVTVSIKWTPANDEPLYAAQPASPLRGRELLEATLKHIDFDGMDPNTFTIAELRRAI